MTQKIQGSELKVQTSRFRMFEGVQALGAFGVFGRKVRACGEVLVWL